MLIHKILRTRSSFLRVFYISIVLIFLSSSPCFALMLSVAGDNVNLRSGPGTNYSVKWEYGKGFPLKILSDKGDWYKVSDFEDDVGWIHKSLLMKDGYMVVKVFKNRDKKINIRSGPSKKYRVVGRAYYGVVFKTLEQRDGWAKVQHETGLVGWIKRSLLWGF